MNTLPAPAMLYFAPDAIRAAIGYEDVVEPMAQALADYSRGLGESPVTVFAPAAEEGDVHVKSAWLPGRSVFTVKVASWFLERSRRGGTPGTGVIAVFDARTGDLRALLEDEHHISDIRTAAAGALAARALARPDSSVLAVLGTGTQAYLQTLAAADVLPVREVRIWGRNPARLRRVADAVRARHPNVHVIAAPTARQACLGADVLVTATASRDPFVDAAWLTPGMHITAVGADDPSKAELSAECFERADRVVVDSRELSRTHGDVARAGMDTGTLPELGQIIAGTASGRENDHDITVCKLIGLGVQDLAATEVALHRLCDQTFRPRTPAAAGAHDL
ncbi:ornithine cyclodeaminase family protein [Streptomyces antibioticus]|uniref:ornithine cyclodeaminase family protein n=1 Tax=Streptomyces antibioticus TaxID=1890 RepID=UPI003403E2F9